MANLFASRIPTLSIIACGTIPIQYDSFHAWLRDMISSYVFSRSFSVIFLESRRIFFIGFLPDQSTQAATTGPAQAPRPASSTPITTLVLFMSFGQKDGFFTLLY